MEDSDIFTSNKNPTNIFLWIVENWAADSKGQVESTYSWKENYPKAIVIKILGLQYRDRYQIKGPE